MSTFNHVRDLYDVALKPRLLRSIIKEQLPDETRPFRNVSDLSAIVSTVKAHRLLSETFPDSPDPKLVSTWNSAVDAWVDRVLSLSRSDLTEKCWVGVCLLGVTCTECSTQRFLASYSDWVNALLSHIQPFGASQFVKVASCTAASDLLIRLGGFSNIKKDGNSLAGKLVQPILKILNEDGDDAVLEVAAHLLSTILTYNPSSVLRYHDNVEGAIVSKIMSGSCSAKSLQKLAFCLASIPKSKGDEESWSLMMQKILLSVSDLLNDSLEGLEEESGRDEVVALLVPPGKDRPTSVGGQKMGGGTLNKGEMPQQLLISTISSLMQSCCTMLTSLYPVQVAVPVRPLLAIVKRVLMVNGSLPATLQPFTTAMQQELVCSQLPVLHLYALEVLETVVKGIRSQLLPYAADIVHIMRRFFKSCWLPELRTKAYSIIKVLLLSMGSGIALYISQEVINNGYIDLNPDDSGSSGVPDDESIVEAAQQHRQKKRKHGNSMGPSMEQHASFGFEVKPPKESHILVGLKVAAVEALEALLVVGGALRSESWRPRIDCLLLEVATDACRGGGMHSEKPILAKEPRLTWEDFQLVALRALLASLLSPTGVRPPYLAQGLELFRKGKQRTGTEVAEMCAQALLALEVLVHPRALPLIDVSLPNSNHYSLESMYFGGPKCKPPQADVKFKSSNCNPHDVYDFLDDVYMEDSSPAEVPASEADKNEHVDKNLVDISRDQTLKEPNIANNSLDKVQGKEVPLPANHDKQIEAKDDSVMVDVEQHKELEKLSPEPSSRNVRPDSSTVVSDFRPVSNVLAFVKDTADTKRMMSTTAVGNMVYCRAENNTSKLAVIEADDDSSDSSFNIVDADPDTDSD